MFDQKKCVKIQANHIVITILSAFVFISSAVYVHFSEGISWNWYVYSKLVILATVFELLLIIHEFGHVLAGLLMFIKTDKITFGSGNYSFDFNFLRMNIEFRSNFNIGITHFALDNAFAVSRFRLAFALTGGILTHALIFYAAYYYYGFIPLKFFSSPDIEFFSILQYANLLMILLSVFPLKLGDGLLTDGLAVIATLFRSFHPRREQKFIKKIRKIIETKGYEEAEKVTRKIIKRYPGYDLLNLELQSILFVLLKFDEMEKECLQLIGREDISQGVQGLTHSNLALRYIFSFTEDALRNARDHSAKAMEFVENYRHHFTEDSVYIVRKVRGYALCAFGDCSEGMDLINESRLLPDGEYDLLTAVETRRLLMIYANWRIKNKEMFDAWLAPALEYEGEWPPHEKILFEHIKEATNDFTL